MAAGMDGAIFAIVFYLFFVCSTPKQCHLTVQYNTIVKYNPSYILIDLPYESTRTNYATAASTDVFLSPIYQYAMKNHQERRFSCKTRGKHNIHSQKDAVSVLLLLTLLKCGDIHQHPGPRTTTKQKRQPKYPCVSCGRGVVSRSRAISCDVCDNWIHARCSGTISDKLYDKYVAEDTEFSYTCNACSFNDLPFKGDYIKIDAKPSNDTNNILFANSDFFDCFRKKGLHCVHVNARSLLPKLSELKILAVKTKASIIAVTETWLDKTVTENEINIPGYTTVRKDRNRNGGGSCIYIKSDLAFNPRPDLDSGDLEIVWAEILLPKTKPIIIGSCYRPPDQSNFVPLFEESLSNLNMESDIIILGDMNICSMKKESSLYKIYQNVLQLFGLNQLINSPTRITKSSSSALDHIICNNVDKISQHGVIPIGFSDHFVIYCTRKITRFQMNQHKGIKIRSLKNYSKETLVGNLLDANWSTVYNSKEVNNAWSSFCSIFTGVLDSVAPIKEVRIKQRSEPWMTNDILVNIRERDFWLTKFKKNQHMSEYYENYCRLRNQIQRDIKHAKRDFMLNKIEDNKFNPKKLWQCLKSLGYHTKSKETSSIVLDIDGKKCYESKSVVDYFNKFFIEIATKLVGMLPRPRNLFDVDSKSFKDFYRHILPNSFKLHEVNEDFVLEELNKLNINKSTGLDGIPARFVKDAADIIKGPITFIVNLSIKSEVFPTDMKLAKVRPLYKKKSKLDAGNYRPVSMLSIISKILENSVSVQLNKYVTDNNILYKFQSGFRGSFSTDTCLIYLQDHIKKQISSGLYTGMVLLDIQKAFDSVDHSILCKKLSAIGVGSTAWFHSYLSQRRQIVNLDGVESDPMELICGVPQGSILGPLLFLCYVNDMPNSVNCMMFQYADDSVLIVSGKDPKDIGISLSKNLESCNRWLIDNKLSLHMGKTELIMFGSKRKLRNLRDFSITCDGQEIKASTSVKYLGLELDQHLAGENIVLDIIKKVNSRLSFLYRQANYLNQKTKRTLCSALIFCLFDYSISSWYGGISKRLEQKLQIAQNKVIRFILSKGPRYHISHSDFKNLGILNIQSRAGQLRLNHMFNIFHKIAPNYMQENFNRISMVHHYNTRGSVYNLQVPRVNSISSGSFTFNGIKDWNKLPNTIKEISHKNRFKQAIKGHLTEQYLTLQ